ncbi:MAG TPA: FmdB family zinc ribbon protein [Blastocatellia bacterium]|nr:FmdB family zinc ribbon protein [Blastocatellia bacterium]
MPIYEYVCDKCGKHLEVMQKMSDAPLKRCPDCRGKLEKVISQTSFQLKGGGWYVTDYAKSGSKSAKTDKTEKTEKTESKSETKTSDSSKSSKSDD